MKRKHDLTVFQFYGKIKQMASLHAKQVRTHSFFNHENKLDSRYKTVKDHLDLMKDDTINEFLSYAENFADSVQYT